MRHASELPASRCARSEGERRAAEDVAGCFEAAGLRVERIEAPALPVPLWAILLTAVACLWFVVTRALPDASPWSHLQWLGLIVVSLVAAAARASTRAPSGAGSVPSRHVLGFMPAPSAAPCRVIVVTRLRTALPRRLEALHWSLFGVAAVVVGALLTPGLDRRVHEQPRVGQALLVGEWLALLALVGLPKDVAAKPTAGDNRTGLALLAELARTWPASAAGRLEPVFAATPDAGALARWISTRQGDPRPTLVVGLDAPGVGPAFTIAGRGSAARLAREAAHDLWVPFRAARWSRNALGNRRYRRPGWACFTLCGARVDRPADPAMIAAAAQLVTEVALRWAKLHQAPRSAARSSQNPG
jgi:hypothetical protein